MIDPVNLEKAYIIDNAAIDYSDEEELSSFVTRKTDIKAIKYRAFVASHPNQITYFQPVLDALRVPTSPLDRSANALIVEGKYDYHPLLYLRRRLSKSPLPEIFPANGAGDVGTLVNLFRGWGVNFRILFDDDPAGRDGKRRCLEQYLVPAGEVLTLGDLNTGLGGMSFEGIYQADVRSAVAAFFPGAAIGKRHYSLFFQELLAKRGASAFKDTEKAFEPVSQWIDQEFGLDAANDKPAKRVKPARK